MYRIILGDEILMQTDSPRFVRKNPSSGAYIQCSFTLAECIAIDGKRYSIEGKELVEDAPDVVTVKQIDAASNALATEQDINLLFFALTNVINDINQKLEG